MVILSIDSGIERTGYALFDKDPVHKDGIKYIHSGLIKTSPSQTTDKRLLVIYEELEKIVTKYKPTTLAIEQVFFSRNQKTAIAVSQSQGVVQLLAAQHNIPVKFLPPLQIKQAVTGYGQSDKKAVQKMIRLTLGLDHELKQDDQADAIACGLAYCYLHRV